MSRFIELIDAANAGEPGAVDDLSPIRDLPLKVLGLEYDPTLHLDLIRSLPKLITVYGENGKISLDEIRRAGPAPQEKGTQRPNPASP
jgi:hypothetical protein